MLFDTDARSIALATRVLQMMRSASSKDAPCLFSCQAMHARHVISVVERNEHDANGVILPTYLDS